MVLSGVDRPEWYEAVNFLLANGFASRTGERRGARYTRAVERARVGVLLPANSRVADSAFAAKYHGVLDEALSELGMAPSPEDREASSSRGPSLGVHSPLAPQAKESALVRLLHEKGITEILDLRPKKGCLWVFNGPGVGNILAQVAKSVKAEFRYMPLGSRQTKGRPAWWTKTKKL